jgi:tagatose-6-phosphate ketose/aldose isomerase
MIEKYFEITADELKAKKGYWTAREITLQTDVWFKAAKIVDDLREEIEAWLLPIVSSSEARVILTGAGTSSFIGEVVEAELANLLPCKVEAISTTNIVASPKLYLGKDTPTLLISYSRSGGSPESVAACELAEQLISNCYHLIITCNQNGALAAYDKKARNSFLLLMPEETHDQGFAMTVSFTSMMLSTIWIFAPNHSKLEKTVEISKGVLNVENIHKVKDISQNGFDRIVFLGAGNLQGIAREASLKMLELTAGKVDCYFDSPLGFRHGPKLIINEKTQVILLNSGHEHCQKYDRDLVAELRRDQRTQHITELSEIVNLRENAIEDIWLSFPYIIFCQMLAFEKSLVVGVTPDNPCPTGEANRVVQAVTIYPLEG